jgi:indole-3-glycerol phosphate synthase
VTTAGAAPDLLATIVAAARTAVADRAILCPIERLVEERAYEPRGQAFAAALRSTAAPRVIAECKRRSPSKGILRQQYDPAVHARAYAAAGAAAISVLTEPTFFDGGPSHLAAARAAVPTPLLRKDFIVTDYQVHESAALGADAILLIAAALTDDELRRLRELAASLGLASLVEVHDRAELDRAVAAGAKIIGVNSRNLRTLEVDIEVTAALAAALPEDTILVAESGIRSADDLRRLTALGYDAFLIGERLITQPDPGAALEALRTS